MDREPEEVDEELEQELEEPDDEEEAGPQVLDEEFVEEFAEAFAEQYAEETGAAQLVHRSLDAFVTEYLAVIIRRRLNRATQVWCPEWWRHPEAIARLAALWRAFEYLSTDPAMGMSTWWLGHADPHLRSLMDPEFGPFALCDPREGHNPRELEGLPLVESPPELWNHPAFSLDASEIQEAAPAAPAAASEWVTRGGADKAKQMGPDAGL
jgi:hypothetical protein